MEWKTVGYFIFGVATFLTWQNSEANFIQCNENKMKKTAISTQKMLNSAFTILEYTRYIGTPEYPTIDGGIINSTEIKFVDQDVPTESQLSTSKPPFAKSAQNTQKSFEDNWATSKKVKKLLTEAANQGKLKYVLNKIDQMKLPAGVAVLPMVESHYQTNAISPKGAAGAWQLMPSTATDYGIKDQERFQFTTSTDTALKLLNDLYQKFNNWELAFAAYNAGSKRVVRAMHEKPNAKTMDELNLPQETKNYVKRIMNINKTMMECVINGA